MHYLFTCSEACLETNIHSSHHSRSFDHVDFWDAFNFWIFFAVGHPLLQPILWISDVLHGSPGPMVFDLVPATFLMANILFIGAAAWSKEVSYFLIVASCYPICFSNK